ncbi:MAG: DnaJ C-terminal domain-containing protein [Cyanophyceae cyanobacterium]
MENFRNYYQILGLSSTATNDEIKQAFRRLARTCHPDLNPGDKVAEEKFKAIGEAYEVLSDASRRAQYDEFSRYWNQKGFQGKGGRKKPRAKVAKPARTATRARVATEAPPADTMDFGEFADFNSFVDRLLERRPPARTGPPKPGSKDYYRPGNTRTSYTVGARKGRDAEARLTIPLTTAYTGGRERIRLEDGRSLEVSMPAGLVTGQRVRLKNQGIDGGDLYLKITVAPHEFFKLDGMDLFCQVPVTVPEAVLGGAIEVPTLDGWVKMTLPPGVRQGQRLRLSNKGYPVDGDRRGDQIVEIQIQIPSQPGDNEKELYRQLKDIDTSNPRGQLPV